MTWICHPKRLLLLQLMVWTAALWIPHWQHHHTMTQQLQQDAHQLAATIPPNHVRCRTQTRVLALHRCMQNTGNCAVDVLEPRP